MNISFKRQFNPFVVYQIGLYIGIGLKKGCFKDVTNGLFKVYFSTRVGVDLCGELTVDYTVKNLQKSGVVNAIARKVGEVTGNVINGVNRTVAKIGKAVIDTGKTIAKNTKSIVKAIDQVLPQSCPTPTHKDWNDAPDNLKNFAKALGMVGILNYLLSKVDIVKKYRYQKNHHHIVMKTGSFIFGLNTMESARKNVREALKNSTSEKDAINDERNMIWIHTAIHVHMHTTVYKTSIVMLFNRGLYLQKEGKQKIISRLSTIKEFLKKTDDFFF